MNKLSVRTRQVLLFLVLLVCATLVGVGTYRRSAYSLPLDGAERDAHIMLAVMAAFLSIVPMSISVVALALVMGRAAPTPEETDAQVPAERH